MVAAELPDASAKAEIDAFADRVRRDPGVAFVAPPRINIAGDRAHLVIEGLTAGRRDGLVHRLRDTVVPQELGGTGIPYGRSAASPRRWRTRSTFITDRMPLFIVGVVGLSFLLLLVAFLAAHLAQGGRDEPAVGRRRLRRDDVGRQGGTVGKLIGIDHEVPIAPFMPRDDVRDPVRPLDGLPGVPDLARIREEYLKHRDTRRAVADGLAKTARVITAAAAIMVVVFLAFLAAPDVFLKLFGIGLASAIFLDATLVRMVSCPP